MFGIRGASAVDSILSHVVADMRTARQAFDQARASFECGGRLSWPGLREAKFQTWRDPRDRADKHQRFD